VFASVIYDYRHGDQSEDNTSQTHVDSFNLSKLYPAALDCLMTIHEWLFMHHRLGFAYVSDQIMSCVLFSWSETLVGIPLPTNFFDQNCMMGK
jgi:hypothetical protein